MFQDGLFHLVSTAPEIKSVLGPSRSDNTTGVYPVLGIGQPILPYVTYQRMSGVPNITYQGANKFTTSRWRFSCYGSTQRNAWMLANAIKDFFADYTGTLNEGTVVQNVMQEFEADDSESRAEGTLFATHVDFMFMYVEP